MGPLSDDEIRARRGLPDADPLRLRIDPFVPAQTKFREADGRRVRVVGYGPSGFGHDVRLGDTFRFLAGPDDGEGLVLDPLDHAVGRCYGPPTVRRGPFVLAPGRCVLAETVERFRIPDDCIAQVFGKSTWARCFVNLNTTALEPGWEGTVTLEVVNLSSLPVRLRPGEGVGQVVFFAGSGPCGVPYYRQPGASYQGQSGPTVPTHAGRGGAQPGAH